MHGLALFQLLGICGEKRSEQSLKRGKEVRCERGGSDSLCLVPWEQGLDSGAPWSPFHKTLQRVGWCGTYYPGRSSSWEVGWMSQRPTQSRQKGLHPMVITVNRCPEIIPLRQRVFVPKMLINNWSCYVRRELSTIQFSVFMSHKWLCLVRFYGEIVDSKLA